jgi:hypothetical protein
MYSQEHEFTAVHEAGHTVCAERFPYQSSPFQRVMAIVFEYDEELERFDGNTPVRSEDLSNAQELFIALGGKVAELMVRSEGNWDINAIQKTILSGEFGDTQDMRQVRGLLTKLTIDDQRDRDQLLTETVLNVFSFLKRNWKVVLLVAEDLLHAVDPTSHEVISIDYDKLSIETKSQLEKLRDNG